MSKAMKTNYLMGQIWMLDELCPSVNDNMKRNVRSASDYTKTAGATGVISVPTDFRRALSFTRQGIL